MGAVLITGASAGLGVEFARQLAEKGLDLVLVALPVDKLDEVKQEGQERFRDVNIRLIVGNLSQSETPKAIAEQISTQGINLHLVNNNAGASGPRLLEDQDAGWKMHQDYLILMMTRITELCHGLVPTMIAAGYFPVINVASVSGRIASACMP